MTPIPPKFSRLLPCLFAVLPLFAVFDAGALEFGALRSNSSLGELLHAELDVDDEAADRFDASCVKLYRPAQASAEQSWITEARLSFRRESGKGRLYISSDHPLRDPVVYIGLQSACAGERMWRDYTLLVSPAGAAGRSEALSPGNAPVAEKRMDRAALPAPRPRRLSAIGARNADGALVLRMATALQATEAIGETERELLRIEYRMLTALHGQVDSQLALAGMLRALEHDASALKAAGERFAASTAAVPAPTPLPAPAPAPVPAPVPAPALEKAEAAAVSPAPTLPPAVREATVPQAIPVAGPQPLSAAAADDSIAWPLYAGLGAAALGLALLLRRRRRAAALEAHFLPMHAPTIIVDEAEFSQPPAKAPVVAVEVVDEASREAPSAEIVAPAVRETPPPESNEFTPVMELAEIMLSFGRVHGAAQALQEYIEANPKAALQPWIRLLEIYRENGMRAEFESLAANLHQNFNVEIVHWDNAVPGERVEMTLELLPHIRDQIDALWGRPECVEYLQKLLHDNRDGQRTGFALPVVKEILVLIDLMVAEKAAAK